MPAMKVSSNWISGDLVFREVANGNGGQVIFGTTNGGVDVVFYGTTGGVYSMWDESANAWINKDTNFDLGDGDYMLFGDSTDASLGWDSAKLALTGAAANSTFQVGTSTANVNTRFVGTIIVGTTDKNIGKDITLYGTTTANYVKLTAASNLLSLINVNLLLGDAEYVRGTSTASPGAPRAGRGRRSRRGRRRARWGRTRAGASAARHPTAASAASSRRTGSPRAPGWGRSRTPSTTRGRWRARRTTSRSCCPSRPESVL